MKRFGLFFLLALAFACNNELDINAPYKDITVVYGALDAAEDTNWVRIHKTFLGTEGINGGKDNPDSLYYSNLQVFIEEKDGENITNVWPLSRDDVSHQLDSGFFTSEGFHLYRLDQLLDQNRTYRLVIDKPDNDGPQVTATTPLVHSFNISKPVGSQKITFGRTGQDFVWSESENARIYQSYLRFYYVEINNDNAGDSVRRHVDYLLPTKLGSSLTGNNNITINVAYETFYRYLLNSIGVNPDVIRFFRGMDIYVTAGADDLTTYINVSQPAEGIVQEKPFYSNVNNGAGIFSSRTSTDKLGMRLSPLSLDSLIKGIYTCDLRFAKASAGDTCVCDRATASGFRCE